MGKEALKEEMIAWQEELYKREMSLEMDILYASFNDWKNGSTDVFALRDKIHIYYKGPAKELFLKYERPSFADLNIAEAVIKGVINIDELSEGLQEIIKKKVDILQRD